MKYRNNSLVESASSSNSIGLIKQFPTLIEYKRVWFYLQGIIQNNFEIKKRFLIEIEKVSDLDIIISFDLIWQKLDHKDHLWSYRRIDLSFLI